MPHTAEPPVLLEYPASGVALLRLNRPQATNALSLELQALLSQHFSELAANAEVRCVVLTGGEQVFAAGGDITSMAGVGAIDIYQRHTERLWAPIQHCPKPVIAAVCGYAYGGGCELAMLADIIIAGRSARFAQPEIRLGIMPGIGGTQRLVRAVGKAKAMRMALTGQPISADEACIAGLVSEVLEDLDIEGLILPSLHWACRNHVGMTCKAQHRAFTAAACPEVVHILNAHRFDVKTDSRQTAHHQLLAAFIHRGDRWTTYQVASKLKGGGQGGHCSSVAARDQS